MGMQRDIYSNISINVSAGVGSAFFIDDGVQSANPPVSNYDGDFSERALILRLGVSYYLR
jgi:hypothetical protein